MTGSLHRIRACLGWVAFAGRCDAEAVLSFLLAQIAADLMPDRPNRFEPRQRKRRPKEYSLLIRPRRWYHLHGDRGGRQLHAIQLRPRFDIRYARGGLRLLPQNGASLSRTPADEIAAPILRLGVGLIDLCTVIAVSLASGVIVAVLRPIDPALPVAMESTLAYGLLAVAVGIPAVVFLIVPTCLGRSTPGQLMMRVRTVRYRSMEKLGLGSAVLVTVLVR